MCLAWAAEAPVPRHLSSKLSPRTPQSSLECPALLPRQLPASPGLLSRGGFIQLTSDAASQRGPSPAGILADRLCRHGTKRWAVTEGCKSFLVHASPGIRGTCWRVSPTLKRTTYWTGASLFFLFFLSGFFFLPPPKANHWTRTGRKVFYSIEILFSSNYVKNVFILWAGWEKKRA